MYNFLLSLSDFVLEIAVASKLGLCFLLGFIFPLMSVTPPIFSRAGSSIVGKQESHVAFHFWPLFSEIDW